MSMFLAKLKFKQKETILIENKSTKCFVKNKSISNAVLKKSKTQVKSVSYAIKYIPKFYKCVRLKLINIFIFYYFFIFI